MNALAWKSAKALVLVSVVALLAGCAETWSSANLKPATNAAGAQQESRSPTVAENIVLTEGDITDRSYKAIGELEVTVNKTTLFNKDPTREMVAAKLREEAAKIGADAVILVRYGSLGISFMSWGSLDGRGRAVVFTE
jgi:hypothetical protein